MAVELTGFHPTRGAYSVIVSGLRVFCSDAATEDLIPDLAYNYSPSHGDPELWLSDSLAKLLDLKVAKTHEASDEPNSNSPEVSKSNPCHNASDGRFCSTSGGSAWDNLSPHGKAPFSTGALKKISNEEHEALSTEWAAKLTDEERKTVSEYSVAGYHDINEGLRKGNLVDSRKEQLSVIDNAIAKSTVEKPILLYRGVSERSAAQYTPGKTVTDKGYVSTASEYNEAVSWALNGALLKIKAPAGTKAAFVNKISGNAGEHEVLLARGQSFRAVSRRPNVKLGPGKLVDVIELEIVPTVSKLFEEFSVEKANSCHVASGPKGGQFCSTGSGGNRFSQTHQPPTDVQDSIDAYATHKHEEINLALREGRTPNSEDAEIVRAMDMGFTSFPYRSSEAETVFRGVQGPATAIRNLAPGDVFTDKGYVSATMEKSKTQFFGGGRTLMEITIPAKRGVLLGLVTESEVILPRGSRFRVSSVKATGEARVISMELL